METQDTPIKTQESFANLINDPGLIDILDKLNIKTPTEVQIRAIPQVLQKKDLIVEAQTGSGKTLAFVLPLLQQLSSADKRRTVALIIAPTRELALQVQSVINSLESDVAACCIIGGANPRAQVRQIRQDARFVVGTPGRLIDFLERRFISLDQCKAFVLDEADEMLSMGFLEEVREILKRLPKNRQGLFFSATISARVNSLASNFLNNPETIVIQAESANAPKIEHLFCKVDGGVTGKANALCRLLLAQPSQSVIVFCNTKSDTELLEAYLGRRGFNAAKISSDLNQRERDKVLADLKEGRLNVLIATDVAARGIDIKALETVINYSIHPEAEIYVHRTGRTGRAGESGRAISLVGPQDFAAFHNLKRQLDTDLFEITIPDILVPETASPQRKGPVAA